MTIFRNLLPVLLILGLLGGAAHGEPGSKAKATEARVTAAAEETTPIEEGAQLPEAWLNDLEGAKKNLANLAAEGPVVLVVYRGGWCPYCNTQLQALAEARPELEALGYELIALSPDKPAKLKESIEEYEIDYTLLSDARAEAAKALGIAFKVDDDTVTKYKGYGIDLEEASGHDHHILPVPTVVIARTGGEVGFVFSDPDYKVRLSNEDLLAAAKAHAN